MTYEQALKEIPFGLYQHFKGRYYEVIDIARHSETDEAMVIYRPQYGKKQLWVRPADMWAETIERDGYSGPRFRKVEQKSRYIAFDVETPNHLNNRMSAIGISVIENGKIIEEFYSLVNPETSFDPFNIQLTGISEELVADKPNFAQLWETIEPIMSSGTLVAHNAVFDLSVLKNCLKGYGISWQKRAPYACTVQMGRKVHPEIRHNLNVMCDYYHIDLDHHNAGSDSHACGELLLTMMDEGADIQQFIKTYYF